MYNARWVITICVFLALFFSLAYIKFLDWCAFTLSWITVFVMQASLIAIGGLALYERSTMEVNS